MNRTVPSTCSVFPCITGGTRASKGFQHFQAPNVPKPVLPRVRGPAPPTLLITSPKKQHHTKTAHALYSPALPRARGGVQVFSTFRSQMFQNLYSPASAAQHPQPCLLILRRSNECRFPSHHTKTAPPRPRPSTPHPAYCFSQEVTKVGFLPTILYRDSTCSVFRCIAAGVRGSTGFPHFQAPNVPKPVLPRVRGPAPPTLLIEPNRTGTLLTPSQ